MSLSHMASGDDLLSGDVPRLTGAGVCGLRRAASSEVAGVRPGRTPCRCRSHRHQRSKFLIPMCNSTSVRYASASRSSSTRGGFPPSSTATLHVDECFRGISHRSTGPARAIPTRPAMWAWVEQSVWCARRQPGFPAPRTAPPYVPRSECCQRWDGGGLAASSFPLSCGAPRTAPIRESRWFQSWVGPPWWSIGPRMVGYQVALSAACPSGSETLVGTPRCEVSHLDPLILVRRAEHGFLDQSPAVGSRSGGR